MECASDGKSPDGKIAGRISTGSGSEALSIGLLIEPRLMSRHFHKVGFFNWSAKGNKKGKKGGFLALFALFAFFVSSSPSLWRQILNMCSDIRRLAHFRSRY